MKRMLDWLRAWLDFMSRVRGAARTAGKRSPKPWHIHIGKKSRHIDLTQSDVDRLLQRHRDLKDMDKIAAMSARFHVPEADFFADPAQVEKLIRRLLDANPPWLYVSRVLSGGDTGGEAQSSDVLYREQETLETRNTTLFIPDDNWRDRPLASLTMRPARHLGEVWQARMLDQILPPELLLDRCCRGEIMVPVRNDRRQRLDFQAIQRPLEVVVRKQVPVPIEAEGDNGQGGQLLYILLDFSSSMRGKSATLAMAVISAALRANMGRRDARYLFRRFAEKDELWPRAVELPVQARTLVEKDTLLDTILATNFNGTATNVNDALDIAVSDINTLKREEQLEPSILLVTDGQAEILESTHLKLRAAGVKVHTVMVTPDKNPGLQSISESFTALNIQTPTFEAAEPPILPATTPSRRAYHI